MNCRNLDWLRPLWHWAGAEIERLMVAHRAAERCRTAAIDTYSRGAFEDAASLFGRALALLQAGCSDDKRGRATVHADRAGCLRRARKLDDAVTDLDAALRLFPRYSRAVSPLVEFVSTLLCGLTFFSPDISTRNMLARSWQSNACS